MLLLVRTRPKIVAACSSSLSRLECPFVALNQTTATATFQKFESTYRGAAIFPSRTVSSTSMTPSLPDKVAVIGAGSFGSAMARILGTATSSRLNATTQTKPTNVTMYARRQIITDEINEKKTNAQYFPNATFPSNVQATSNLEEAVNQAKVIVLAVPGEFLYKTLESMREGGVEEDAVFVSVIKSIKYDQGSQTMKTTVDGIREVFPDHIATALSGPNLYTEMASDLDFAEATVAYNPQHHTKFHSNPQTAAQLVQTITTTPCSFRTTLSPDLYALELCGGLKNVISLAAGFAEGLGWKYNAKAAIIRAGMWEMARFIEWSYKAKKQQQKLGDNDIEGNGEGWRGLGRKVVFESAGGVGDLMLTCTAGRGRVLASTFLQHVQSNSQPPSSPAASISLWSHLETTTLNGMKLPDWHNAQHVHQALVDWNCTDEFPLLCGVYRIAFQWGCEEYGGGGEVREILGEALGKSIQMASSSSSS